MGEKWKYHFRHAADPLKEFNYIVTTIFSKSGGAYGTAIDPGFKDSSWRTLQLPHDWVVELPFAHLENGDVESHGYKPVGGFFPETSIGWYRKHFNVSAADSGTRFQIQFDGIFRNANIWVNGFYVGNNLSGYIGAAYDITDFIRFDRDNVLVVRVDATQYEGWFYEGAGIYRHVWLNQFDNLHVTDGGLFVHSESSGKNTVVTIVTTVENQGPATSVCNVYASIMDRAGNKIAQTKEQEITLAESEKATLKQKISII